MPSTGQTTPGVQAISEVELMHHYTIHTYATLSENPDLQTLWKEAVPKQAFEHRFLLQGLFTITAMHMVHNEDPRSTALVHFAASSYQEALSEYIRLVGNITQQNCHALFAFSQLIAGSSCYRLFSGCDGEMRTPGELLSGVVEVFELLKGAIIIAEAALEWLEVGDLAAMLADPPRVLLDTSHIQPSILSAFVKLKEGVTTQGGNGPENYLKRTSLMSMIGLVQSLFLPDQDSENRLNQIVGLPAFFDATCFTYLKQRDEAYLTVLAFYGVALHELRGNWCIGSLGARIVETVRGLVSKDWEPYLAWPQIETGISI